MAKYNSNSLRIDADYTEELVGFALDSFLTVFSFPNRRFSIEPFSRKQERWLGADARLHGRIRGFRPFYMQFKRPSAYPDFSAAAIIRDRKALQLRTSPRALYFPFRDKKDGHRDFQHNILLRLRQHLRNRQLGDAAYVCPLFLDRSAYRFHLHWSGLAMWPRFWRSYPWEWDDVLLNDRERTIHFDRIPALAEHVTIPPHDTITTAKHRYSFSEAGTELCFHSPEAVHEGTVTLAAFLTAVSDGFLDRGEKIRLETAQKELRLLIEATEGSQPDSFSHAGIMADDPFASWAKWGDYLHSEYGIDQYALVSWED